MLLGAEERAEVVERQVPGDERRPAQRIVRVERGRDDVRDGEERDDRRDQGDQVTPPRLREAASLLLLPLACGRNAEPCFARGAHARFSSALVRENEIAEIVPTITKMRIAIAQARP